MFRRIPRVLLAVPLALTLLGPAAVAAPRKAPPAKVASKAAAGDLAARLAALENKVEERRKAHHIPGVALVIVKNDKVIYLKGLGLRDRERNLPVTPDTLFAIGSSSKAFTAATVLMSQDDGKLKLTDPPKKYLPYFTLRDPEAAEKITIRDLLSHRSGLSRTDIAWAVGTLSRKDVIRVAGLAKPTAKFGEKFQYQNVMYAVAGEVVASVQKTPWETFVERRLFAPLGMTSSNLSTVEMQKARDFSRGYEYNEDTKQYRRLPMRDLPAIAPAGAINSSARDMAQWLRLMINGGTVAGKRLLSPKAMQEMTSKQMAFVGNTDYGLGWFLRDWKGRKVVEHGGNIDGFNADVAFLPEEKLGFAILTNVSFSPLASGTAAGAEIIDLVCSHLIGPMPEEEKPAPATGPAVAAEKEAGKYLLAEGGLTVEMAVKDGKLTMFVPGQPTYTLENVGGRRYKLGAPAPAGFFVTFRPAKNNADETEVYLEQPQGNYVLARLREDAATVTAEASEYSGPLKDLLGAYESEKVPAPLRVVAKDGKVLLTAPGQQPRVLVEKEKDTFGLEGLPDGFRLVVRRDAAGKVSGLLLKQPQGELELTPVAPFVAPMTADELMAKAIAAAGGEENLRKQQTTVTTFEGDWENQGLTFEGTVTTRWPNATAMHMTIRGLGKPIGWVREYFDGTAGGEENSFSPASPKTGKALDEAKLAGDVYPLLNWKTLFKTVSLRKLGKVGDEEAYVVEKTPAAGGIPITEYISTRSFLLLRRDRVATSSVSPAPLPVSETYGDYRAVQGVMRPFSLTVKTAGADTHVMRVKDVKVNVPVPDDAFRPSSPSGKKS